jgi:diadenosine tetraphosphate (Ap4A) HIT family hydrolase
MITCSREGLIGAHWREVPVVLAHGDGGSVLSNSCPICGDLARDPDTSGIAGAYGERALSQAQIVRAHGFAVFVPVAPLLPGYLMVAPAKHETESLLAGRGPQDLLIDEVLSRMMSKLGAAWAFEHSGRSVDGPSCVDHAHVHLLPGFPPADLMRHRPAPLTTADVIVRTTTGAVGFDVPERSKQYVRRLIAEDAGLGPAWDWRIYRHAPIYETTAGFLRNIMDGIDDAGKRAADAG